MGTKRVIVTLTDEQIAALKAAQGRVSQAQFVRDAVGAAVQAAGIVWPDGPQVGGDRKSAEKGQTK